MSALRKWVRKVVTGVAAFLLTCLELLGSVDMSYAMMPYGGFAYSWTDHGIRAMMVQEEMQKREEQRQAQEQLYIAQLEGAVYEDQVRSAARRGAVDGEKAAS